MAQGTETADLVNGVARELASVDRGCPPSDIDTMWDALDESQCAFYRVQARAVLELLRFEDMRAEVEKWRGRATERRQAFHALVGRMQDAEDPVDGTREDREEWGVRQSRGVDADDVRSSREAALARMFSSRDVLVRRTVTTITYADGATTVHTTAWQVAE